MHSFVLGKPSGRTNNFPQRGRGLGHVTLKIFGIRPIISSKLLELGTSNLVHSFVLRKSSGCINNFPQKGRGLGHVTPIIFGIRSNISSKLLQIWCIASSWESRAGAQTIFPKGAWLRSRDPYNFWHMIEHIFKTT